MMASDTEDQDRAAVKPARPWATIPGEVRNMILETLADDCDDAICIESYAEVSTEWQSFFERFPFRHLTLDASDLNRFEKAVARGTKVMRLKDVHHLTFRIKLPDYTCLSYHLGEAFSASWR